MKTVNPETRALQRLSASSLNTLDTSEYGGCEARWWWKYVDGRKEPQGKGAVLGSKCHSEIEHYLGTGEMTLGPITLAGKRFMPQPGKDLWLEAKVDLQIDDTPMIGYIDCMHERPETIDQHGDPTPMDADLEVIDWKNLSDLTRAKKPSDLLKTIQMAVYGKYAVELGAKRVRLSHVTMKTRGRPDAMKSTRVHTADEINARWEQVVPLARRAREVAQIIELSDVPKNTKSCDAYGGCPHKAYCHTTTHQDLSRLFGTSGGNKEMSLLKNRKKETKANPLTAVIDEIKSFNQGFPQLRGAALKAYADATGAQFSDDAAGSAGYGSLSEISLTDADQFEQLLAELRADSTPDDAPAPVLPPDAPESSPDKAAVPIDDAPSVEEKPKKKTRKKKASDTPAAEQPSSVPVVTGNTLVLVDAALVDAPTMRLETYVWGLADNIAEQYGARDIRCASKDSPLGFGAWRGVLAASIRTNPPTAGYYSCASGGDLIDVALEALASVDGVTIIRGTR